jgi:hypothetical protein
MHELAFADAVRPTPVVIFNLRLADYTIGHEILLLRRRNHLLISSPAEFASLDPIEQIRSLREAVWLCAMPYSEHLLRESGTAGLIVRTWHEFQRRFWNWTLRNLEMDDYNLAAVEFRNYLTEAHAVLPCPDSRAAEICAESNGYTPPTELRGRSLGSPFLCRLLDFAVAHDIAGKFHSGSTPFDLSYALVADLYLTQAEAAGSIWVENAEEHDEKLNYDKIVEKARQMEAEEAAKPPSERHSTEPPPGLATAIPAELLNQDPGGQNG